MREPCHYPEVKIFPPNTRGRDFVVGDIHGHFEHLHTALKAVNFNPQGDRVFSVGDFIDRGPNSGIALAWLGTHWFHAVRGNHEQAAVECAAGTGDIAKHKRTGGSWLYELPASAQSEIVKILGELPLMIEISLSNGQTVGIVHAQAPALSDTDGWKEAKDLISGLYGADAQRNALTLALTARSKLQERNHGIIRGLDRLYVGHSTVPQIIQLGNVIYVDTGCSFGDGALTLVELNTGAVTMVPMRGEPGERTIDSDEEAPRDSFSPEILQPCGEMHIRTNEESLIR